MIHCFVFRPVSSCSTWLFAYRETLASQPPSHLLTHQKAFLPKTCSAESSASRNIIFHNCSSLKGLGTQSKFFISSRLAEKKILTCLTETSPLLPFSPSVHALEFPFLPSKDENISITAGKPAAIPPPLPYDAQWGQTFSILCHGAQRIYLASLGGRDFTDLWHLYMLDL